MICNHRVRDLLVVEADRTGNGSFGEDQFSASCYGSRRWKIAIPFQLFAALLLTAGITHAQTICTVTSNADSGPQTLRAFISDLSCSVIVFHPSVTLIQVASDLEITRTLRINGPGAGLLTIRGGHLGRVVRILSDFNPLVSISGVTITSDFPGAGAGG